MVKLININDVVGDEHNIKLIDDTIKQKIITYIKEFGQMQLIVVRSDMFNKYKIIKGHTIFDACKSAGLEMINVMDLGDVSDESAVFHYIRLSTLKQDIDTLELAYLMKPLLESMQINELVKMLPFSLEQLQMFTEIFNFNWNQYNDKVNENQKTLF